MIAINLATSFLIATTIWTILILWALHKYFVKPYIKLQRSKKYKGGLFLYRPIIGLLRETKEDGITHGDSAYSIKKRVVDDPSLRFAATTFLDKVQLQLYDPELVKQFLNKDTVTTAKYNDIFPKLSDFLMNGLVFTQGEHWKRQRKLLSQVFHFDYMNSSLPTIRATTKEWIEKNCKNSSASTPVNVSKELKMFTSTVLWRIFFGEDRFDQTQNAHKTVELILGNIKTSRDLAISIWNILFGPKFFKLGLRSIDRKFNREKKEIKSLFYSKFEQLRAEYNERCKNGAVAQEPAKFKNLIELLLEQPEGLPDIEIISQIFTFFLAGTDTTSELLTISHYFLGTHPEIQTKLREEILAQIGKIEEITYDHISKLEYLNAFIKEALRVGGPVPMAGLRVATKDFMLGDIEIEKGTFLQGTLAGAAHSSKYFSEPEKFRPERWIEKTDRGTVETSTHLPFSAGARRCIGEQLALIESKVMLCELIRQFNIELKTPFDLKMRVGIVYHAEPDVHVIYTPFS